MRSYFRRFNTQNNNKKKNKRLYCKVDYVYPFLEWTSQPKD